MGRKSIVKARSRNEVKREKWVEECIVQFEETGLKNITMDDVAKKLGISKATIYNHFKSKDEIVQTAVAQILNKVRRYEEFLNDVSQNYIKRYYKAIRFYVHQISGISPGLVSDVEDLYPEMWQYIKMFREQFGFVLSNYYEEGKKRGYFKKDLDLNMMVSMDRWFIETILSTNYLKEKEVTIDEAFDQYFKIKFDGIISSHMPEIKDQLDREEALEAEQVKY
jgi:AcrR family transcriptional regulator